MPDFYKHDDDGKIHTRWSELKRATPGGAERLVMERMGLAPKWTGMEAGFGQARHEMWEEESKRTGLIPECFWPRLPFVGIDKPEDAPLTHVESELAYELFPGVVIHFTPDSLSEAVATVFDNKTIGGQAKQFATSDQLLVYAFLYWKLTGVRIVNGVWLCEIWSKERERILAYDNYQKKYGLYEYGA